MAGADSFYLLNPHQVRRGPRQDRGHLSRSHRERSTTIRGVRAPHQGLRGPSTWTASAVYEALRRLQARDRDLTALRGLRTVQNTQDRSCTSHVLQIAFKEGDAYYKRTQDNGKATANVVDEIVLREFAASYLARRLGNPWAGLVPAVILADIHGHTGALMSVAPGEVLMTNPTLDGIDQQQVDAAALFDALIANTDRHHGNALRDSRGDLSLIDHGFAFDLRGPGQRGIFLADRLGCGRALLKAGERVALQRLRDDPSLLGMRLILPAAAADGVKERATRMLAADACL